MSNRGMTSFANTKSAPIWLKDFEQRGRVNAIFPAKIKPDEFGDDGGVLVVANGAGTAGASEVQTITIDATGGNFKIQSVEPGFEGETADLAWNASAATVQAALENFFGVGNVLVTLASLVYTIKSVGAFAFKNVAALTTTDTLTGGGGTATVATSTAGSAGSTTLTVTALTMPLLRGSLLRFSNGASAVLTANAAAGATSIAISGLSGAVQVGNRATVSRLGDKLILSGRLCGRTYTERDAGEGFGPWNSDDDEVYLLLYTVDDAIQDDDAEMLAHGATIAENLLPDWSDLTDAAQAIIRSKYNCILGFGG